MPHADNTRRRLKKLRWRRRHDAPAVTLKRRLLLQRLAMPFTRPPSRFADDTRAALLPMRDELPAARNDASYRRVYAVLRLSRRRPPCHYAVHIYVLPEYTPAHFDYASRERQRGDAQNEDFKGRAQLLCANRYE